jgi:hypothetical protein
MKILRELKKHTALDRQENKKELGNRRRPQAAWKPSTLTGSLLVFREIYVYDRKKKERRKIEREIRQTKLNFQRLYRRWGCSSVG